ncbi:hypothetical protein KUTeg_017343 [Tegillarca granosa]|uniref:Uncharacterized protein n=1 Tax=Tegillarca granosa TaxID=220873 RepID=A0ABQ9EIM9_TEGGR|nr:hypothetical protein KUTeg_017343 [Tegillarca granosa]
MHLKKMNRTNLIKKRRLSTTLNPSCKTNRKRTDDITSTSEVHFRPIPNSAKVSHNSTYENVKNKALDEVPKGRQLPSPRNDVEENKIRLPTKLPPLNHEENSTSSPKKKKKKRKSKENENEDKSE